MTLPAGKYTVDVLVPGVIDWQQGQQIEFPQTPDGADPRPSVGGTGEAWGTPTLRLAGTTFRSDK